MAGFLSIYVNPKGTFPFSDCTRFSYLNRVVYMRDCRQTLEQREKALNEVIYTVNQIISKENVYLACDLNDEYLHFYGTSLPWVDFLFLDFLRQNAEFALKWERNKEEQFKKDLSTYKEMKSRFGHVTVKSGEPIPEELKEYNTLKDTLATKLRLMQECGKTKHATYIKANDKENLPVFACYRTMQMGVPTFSAEGVLDREAYGYGFHNPNDGNPVVLPICQCHYADELHEAFQVQDWPCRYFAVEMAKDDNSPGGQKIASMYPLPMRTIIDPLLEGIKKPCP